MAFSKDQENQLLKLLKTFSEKGGSKQEINFLASLINSGNDFDQVLKTIINRIDLLNDNLNESFSILQSVVDELSKGRESFNRSNRAARKLLDINGDLLRRREKLVDFSSKDLNNLEKQLKTATSNLEFQAKFLEKKSDLNEEDTNYLKNIQFLLNEEYGVREDLLNQIKFAVLEQKALDNALGLTGRILKDISKIPVLGQFVNIDSLRESSKQLFQETFDNLKEETRYRKQFISFEEKLNDLRIRRSKFKDITEDDFLKGKNLEEVLKRTDKSINNRLQQIKRLKKEFAEESRQVEGEDRSFSPEEEAELAERFQKIADEKRDADKSLGDLRENKKIYENAINAQNELKDLNNEILKIEEKRSRLNFKLINKAKERANIVNTITKETKEFFTSLGDADYRASLLNETLSAVLVTGILAISKGILSINEQTTRLTKNLALSAQQASALRSEFAAVADNSGKTFVTTKALIEAQYEFNRLLGLQGKVNTENAETFVRLQKAVGVSAENAAKLQFFAEATGNNFEQQYLTQLEQTQAISEQFGVQLNQRAILDDIGQQSAYTLAQFQGSVTQLSEAVALAKALGLELATVNKIAGSILEFETSIKDELQAELLLGKDINLENARLAALNNDQLTLMKEINQEVGTFNDFSNLNRIQQEAIAQALGLSVEEMADMLLLQQYEQKNRAEIVALAGEEVADRVETLSLQQRFNDAIEKLQDLVVNLVEGPLGRFASTIADLAQNSVILETAIGALAGLSLVRLVGSLGAMAVQMGIISAGAITLSSALTFGLGAIAIGGGIAAALAYFNRAKDEMTRVDDFVSPGYGKRILSTPEGSIALNDKDTIVAGTNLTQNSVISGATNTQNSVINGATSTQQTTSTVNNTTQMMADNSNELKAIKNVLEKIATNEGSININGTKFGTVTAMNTYQIQ